MSVKVRSIKWLGVKTGKFQKLREFYEDIFGLKIIHEEKGFVAYDIENGDRVEVFAEDVGYHDHFTTGPVVGFLVDDIELARAKMEASGIELIGGIDGNLEKTQWAHFRGPDGNIYELTSKQQKCFKCRTANQLEDMYGYAVCSECKSTMGLFTKETVQRQAKEYHKDNRKNAEADTYEEEIRRRLDLIEEEYIGKKIRLLSILDKL